MDSFFTTNLTNIFLARARHDSGDGAIFPIVFIAIFIMVVVFVSISQRKERKKTRGVWTTVAKVAGLHMFDPDKFLIEGQFEGYKFSIYEEIRGSGKSRTTYTIFEARVKNAAEHTLQIRKENCILDSIGKAFGMQDTQIKDSEFNKSFIIKSDSEPFVVRIFTPKIRKIMLEELKDAMLELNGPIVKFSISGLEKNGEKMIAVIAVVAELCNNIDSFSGAKSRILD